MSKIYSFTSKELRQKNLSGFKNGDVNYVKPREDSDYKYIIELIKEKYDVFSLESRVASAKNYDYLGCTVGNRRGMRPYFIDDFLHREDDTIS